MVYGSEQLLLLVLRTPTGRAITAVVCVFGSVCLAVFAVPDGIDQGVLWSRHALIRADVTDTRSDRDADGNDHYAVQYAFRRDGRTYRFHRRFGRDWHDVSDAERRALIDDHHVDVIYDPTDPANNTLASQAGSLLAWSAGLTLVPIAMTAASVGWLVRMIVGRLRESLFTPQTG